MYRRGKTKYESEQTNTQKWQILIKKRYTLLYTWMTGIKQELSETTLY